MPFATSVDVGIKDEAGKSASTGIFIPSTTSLANANYLAQALALLLEAVHGGVTDRLSITYTVTKPAGLRANALADASVAKGARFQYKTPAGFSTGLRIPCFLDSLLDTSRYVDLTDAGVLALNNGMVGGISLVPVGGAGAVNPCNISEDDISLLVSAKEAGKFVPR